MLSKQAIVEFQHLYKKEFGLELSFEEAAEQANNLLQLYKIVLTPQIDQQARSDNDGVPGF